MKIIAFFVLVTGGALYVWQPWRKPLSAEILQHQQFKHMQQQGAPDFRADNLLGGGAIVLSSLAKQQKGEASILMVHFWASWCTPCAKEFPSLLKWAQQKASRVQLVALSLDNQPKKAMEFLRSFAPQLVKAKVKVKLEDIVPSSSGPFDNVHIVMDAQRKIANQYGLVAVPETYIINSELKLLRKIVGELNWARQGAVK